MPSHTSFRECVVTTSPADAGLHQVPPRRQLGEIVRVQSLPSTPDLVDCCVIPDCADQTRTALETARPSAWYYAVHGGPSAGVYTSWDEALTVSKGYNGARCRKFDNLKDAQSYVKEPRCAG